MNIIEKQADHFFKMKFKFHPYQDFIDKVEYEVIRYSKVSHKLQFLETVMFLSKSEYDKHLEFCKDTVNCHESFCYESIIFFLNETRIELQDELTEYDFNEDDVLRHKTKIDEILERINTLQLGQQLTYDDFSEQFEEMKSYFFMNKRTWKQMLAGKLLEMVAAGIVSETVSKEILEGIG
jgi:hypothetical protein